MRRALVAVAVLAGLWCLWAATRGPAELAGTAPADGYTRVAGVVHVHTNLSDGGGSVDDVVAAAKAAGLQFVAITDHNVLDAKPFEGYHDGVLVIVGTEISTTAGHVVALGIPDPPFRFSGGALDALEDARDLGGIAFAAHPSSPREDFRWTGWELPGPWGVELMNGDSQWRSAGGLRLVRAAVTYPLNGPYALAGSLTDPRETLARWDALLAHRPTPGVMGADAHQRMAVGKRYALPVPSYATVIRLARTHVLLDRPLTGSAAEDAGAIVDALGRGRSWVGVDALAPAGEVSFVAEAGGQRWTMGDGVTPRTGLRVSLGGRMPAKARAVILKDGHSVAEGTGGAGVENAGPGVYRAEVRLDGWDVPWVLTNAITVADEATQAERREAAAWPDEPPAPAAVVAIEGTAFAQECDTSSRVAPAKSDPMGAIRTADTVALDFSLGTPTAGHPDVFCAFVDRNPPALAGRSGLVLSLRGDRAYRLWVQVRDENPASADEGTEWWFASVKTSPERRRVAIPFASLRSINPKTDGRLDLDKVKAIVLVLDKGSVKPGTKGRIEIGDIGLF